MSDGKDCKCGAHSYSECGCPDADWSCGKCKEKDIIIAKLKEENSILISGLYDIATSRNCLCSKVASRIISGKWKI